jgi:hypothetical protein
MFIWQVATRLRLTRSIKLNDDTKSGWYQNLDMSSVRWKDVKKERLNGRKEWMIRWLSTPSSDIPELVVAHVSIIPGWVPERLKKLLLGSEGEKHWNRFSCSTLWDGTLSLNMLWSFTAGARRLEPLSGVYNLSVNVFQGFKSGSVSVRFAVFTAWLWRMASSGAALVRTDVSKELSASFIRVTRIGEVGTMLAVTCVGC